MFDLIISAFSPRRQCVKQSKQSLLLRFHLSCDKVETGEIIFGSIGQKFLRKGSFHFWHKESHFLSDPRVVFARILFLKHSVHMNTFKN
jgi:hypothetical protein